MSQTDVAVSKSPVKGMIADAMEGMDIRSFANTDTINLDFGYMVALGADDAGAIAPATSGAKMLGINTYAATFDPGPFGLLVQTGSNPGLKPGAALNVMARGRIWVAVEEAVNAEDQAYVRYASGAGGTILGAFRKSADTSTAVAVKGKYKTSQATPGGLAILEFNAEVF